MRYAINQIVFFEIGIKIFFPLYKLLYYDRNHQKHNNTMIKFVSV